jgi:hypothetical protein
MRKDIEEQLLKDGFRYPTPTELTAANAVDMNKFRKWMMEQKAIGRSFQYCISFAYKAKQTIFGPALLKELKEQFEN